MRALRDFVDLLGVGLGAGFAQGLAVDLFRYGRPHLDAHPAGLLGWGPTVVLIALTAYLLLAPISGFLVRNKAVALATERDEARQAADLWFNVAKDRAASIVDLRREIAVLTRNLDHAYDSIGALAVEAQRQPVRGEGGRFKKRVAS